LLCDQRETHFHLLSSSSLFLQAAAEAHGDLPVLDQHHRSLRNGNQAAVVAAGKESSTHDSFKLPDAAYHDKVMASFTKDGGEFDLDGWLDEAKAMIGDNYSPLTMDDTVVILEGERELPDDDEEDVEDHTSYDLEVLGTSSGTNGHDKELDGSPSYNVERALALDFTNYCTDFVDCRNGMEYVSGTGTGKTCLDACGGYPTGDCCVGDSTENDACQDATVKICKDNSCSGNRACFGVGRSYNGGTGHVGGIVNSCKGSAACNTAGQGRGSSASGSVGVIKVSKLQ